MKVPRITEKEFTDQVIKYAKMHGWTVAHFRPARTSKGWRTPVQADGAGFPDLIMIRNDKCIVAELKRDAREAQATPRAQVVWLARFQEAGVKVFLWTPDNWTDIEAILGGIS